MASLRLTAAQCCRVTRSRTVFEPFMLSHALCLHTAGVPVGAVRLLAAQDGGQLRKLKASYPGKRKTREPEASPDKPLTKTVGTK